MPCFHPITAWRSQTKTAAGKRPLIFTPNGAFGDKLEIPCGRCIGCRLERARQWSLRIMHEAQFYDETSFLTLTYSDANVPADGSLSVRDYQLFWKRLRKHLGAKRVRFFGCGEYGETTHRPHYHAVLFGHAFLEDRQRYGQSKANGEQLYTSSTLDDLWGLGQCWLGSVTIQSAGYVARYTLKKVHGDMAESHYQGRTPEFMTCSKGIGARWFELFRGDLYPDDFAIFKGRKMPVPKYYDRKLPEDELADYKEKRKLRALASRDNKPDRLAVREEVTKSRISTLKRK